MFAEHADPVADAQVRERAEIAAVDQAKALEHATGLLNQQLWCWGRDIEFADDNLLLRHGFQRTRLSEDTSSIYRLELSPESRVMLRGFCVFFGQDGLGGLFVRRFGFCPRFSSEADLTENEWRADDFSAFRPPVVDQVSVCHSLLLGLVNWIRDYEAWIVECEGLDYRTSTLVNWKSVVTAAEMVPAWNKLSLAISDTPGPFLMNASDDD